MNIQKTDNTNFGMAVTCKSGYSKLKGYMFERLNDKQYVKFDAIIQAQKTNPVDVFISVVEKNGKKKLEVEVGSKVFKENIFQSGLKAFKKAVKYANKLYSSQS